MVMVMGLATEEMAMEEAKISEGEWIYMPARGEVVCAGKGVIAELIVNGDEDANGRKMAAAPELLEALQEMVGSLGVMVTDADSCPEIIKARAAIAKALGK